MAAPRSPRRRRVAGLFTHVISEPAAYRDVPVLRMSTASLTKRDDTGLTTKSIYRNYMEEIPQPWTDEMPEYWPEKMPAHWRTPVKPLHKIVFTTLCIGALGQYRLVHLWEVCREEESFRARKERMMERITTITVVAGLLLGAIAAFVTTPPPLPGVINYNIRGAYILMLAAFSMTLATIIVGSTILYALSEMKREWFIHTLMTTRSNVYCFLLLMGYPFASVGLATSTAVLGLLVAAWKSQDMLVKVGAVFFVAVPAAMGPIYLWSIRFSRPRDEPLARTQDELAARTQAELSRTQAELSRTQAEPLRTQAETLVKSADGYLEV